MTGPADQCDGLTFLFFRGFFLEITVFNLLVFCSLFSDSAYILLVKLFLELFQFARQFVKTSLMIYAYFRYMIDQGNVHFLHLMRYVFQQQSFYYFHMHINQFLLLRKFSFTLDLFTYQLDFSFFWPLNLLLSPSYFFFSKFLAISYAFCILWMLVDMSCATRVMNNNLRNNFYINNFLCVQQNKSDLGHMLPSQQLIKNSQKKLLAVRF